MRAHKLTLAGLTVLGALAMSAAPADAVTGYANFCPSLATALCTVGTILPVDVAVDNSSGSSAGDVWVASGLSRVGEQKLVKFDASGNQLVEISEESASTIAGVAVDPANGDVYASDLTPEQTAGTVTKYDSSGIFQFRLTGSNTPQGSFYPTGMTVDPSSGDLYVTDIAHGVLDKFTSLGAYVEQFAVGGSSVAVDSKGDLFFGESEYSSTGVPIDCADGASTPFEGSVVGPIAIDPSNDHIYVGEQSPSDGFFIAEYSAPCTPMRVRFGAGEFGNKGAPGGIGVNGLTHEVYAGVFQGEVGLIFRQVQLPDVTAGTSATSITRTSAVVSGTVNPVETSVTTCEFEYGTTLTYGQSVPCSQSLPLEGNSPITVDAEITGLSLPPASLIHYRLKAANSNGRNTSEDETFYTEPLPPPVIGGVPAANVSQFAATLNATIQTGEGLVNYHFEYGTSTAYGSVAPMPDLYTPITTETLAVSQGIAGLQAGTTYHYRIVASSPGQTGVVGPDVTFTTQGIPAPSVATGGVSGVSVGTATLTGAVDPHAWDTTYYFQYGTSTAYGASWPSVPIDIGALEGAQGVLIYVQNLLPGTVYHYRLLASNGGGTTYGLDMTFTTGEYPVSIIQEPPLIGVASVAPRALTNAQKLAKALAVCRKKPKRQRAGCKSKARKRYGAKTKKKK